jgi:hypothetical protein
MQPVETTIHKENVIHILKLSVFRCSPWRFTLRKGVRNLENQEISFWDLHTHYIPHFHDEMIHYDTGSIGKVSNAHPEPIQYSELCCVFLALLNSNGFSNIIGHPIFSFQGQSAMQNFRYLISLALNLTTLVPLYVLMPYVFSLYGHHSPSFLWYWGLNPGPHNC